MKRKVLSVLLTCALVFSSFTGIGIPVKAAGTEEARTNYALSSNGATASASAQYGNMTPDKINDGIIGTGNERWSSEQGASQWASINFGGQKHLMSSGYIGKVLM